MAKFGAVMLCSFVAIACGDDGDSDKDAGATGGGNGAGNGASNAANNGLPGMDGCDDGSGGNGGNTTCTQQEQDDYSDCLQNACDTEKKKCLGPDYAAGTFAGVCGTYIKCTADCDCDTTCVQACGQPSTECQNCLINDLNACNSRECPIPGCYTGGATTGGATAGGESHTCAQLKACCDSMASGATKDQCTQTYMGVMAGGDQACSIAYGPIGCK